MNQNVSANCVVMFLEGPQQQQVTVRVAGDLDAAARPALNGAVAGVAALSPEHVFVDLAEVAFAGSALPNFLAGLVEVLPPGASVTVCRPRPTHQWVLEMAGMAQTLTSSSRPAGPISTHEDGSCVSR